MSDFSYEKERLQGVTEDAVRRIATENALQVILDMLSYLKRNNIGN